MPSLGHAWAISFGSLGSSFHALSAATDLSGAVIAPWMAVFLGIVCFQVGFLVLWVAGGKKTLAEGWVPMLLMGGAMVGVQFIAALLGLWTIAAMLGSLAGLGIGITWAILQKSTTSNRKQATASWISVLPYVLLLVIIFAEKLFPPVQDFLNQVIVKVNVPAVATSRGWHVDAGATRSISIFGHPGALLMYAGIGTWLIALWQKRLPSGSNKRIAQGVVRSGLKSTLGILTLVCMSMTMRNTGMIALLSQAMVNIAGQLFPLVSPFIGALGAFMTGSNTNSNLLFGAFQQNVAGALGFTVPIILAIHNAGAAVGSVFAPAKVIVGCSTVGLSGGEGAALQRITRYGLAIVTSLALLGWIASSLF
jgi:lactate permease